MSCLNKSYDSFGRTWENSGKDRMKNRCCALLAGFLTCVLLAVIAMIWVRLGQDNSFTHTLATTQMQTDSKKAEASAATRATTRAKNTYVEERGEVEYVRPMKARPPPLHTHDILYDQLRNNNDRPQIRHHSGNFRRIAAELWDPHPQYEIDAFNKKLVLELTYHSDDLVSPDLQVIRMMENYTQRVRHNTHTAKCYYTGTVRGDPNSNVVVSLCHGMTGSIKTTDGTYEIEPVEDYPEETVTSILHKIVFIHDESGGVDFDCETKSGFVTDEEEENHRRRKRSPDYSERYQWMEEVRHAKNKRMQMMPSNPYFIETLIVADKMMTEYHQTEEVLIHYVLTLMAHVATLYKDATIGNPISITVVDIMILQDTEFTSTAGQEMLAKFCDFQHRYSRKKHDVALLLTRDMICKNCTTLGIAEVGSMCTPSSSCAIARDKGLSTSYTIAHELGHVLSMSHDDDSRCAKFQGGQKANHLMSKMHQGKKLWHWSTCSKHYLTEFLDSPKSQCLLNSPTKDYITSEFDLLHLLPGETFQVDQQCELEFGSGWKLCPYKMNSNQVGGLQEPCGSLWCMSPLEEGCRTQFMPWAEGTSCGKNKWCHHGKCINLDRQILSPVAGGWGSWQEWGPCSRSCGGGIKVSKRECNNPSPANGGSYCTGSAVRYSSCNTQDCDPNVPTFRELQCSKFNGHTKGVLGLTSDVEWVPKYGVSNNDVPDADYCKLYCRPNHYHVGYYVLAEKVIDGTKCGLNSFDICVNGICHKGGCDNQLDSNANLDECGICNGDNSKCVIISATYNQTNNNGYYEIHRIPKGSFNIQITQTGYNNSHLDHNYLVLRDGDTGEYILNGNSQVSTSAKKILYGGLMFMYSGSNQSIEEIYTPKNGKLKKDVILQVLSVENLPPDIFYSYKISNDNSPNYAWHNELSPCSSICNGQQNLMTRCINLVQNEEVDHSYCAGLKRKEPIDCNTHCKLEWTVSSRSSCSSHCGLGTVAYICMKYDFHSGTGEQVDEKHCQALETPVFKEDCFGLCQSTHWEYSEWTQCTQTCGGGLQSRSAVCVDLNRNQLDDVHCNVNERDVERVCNGRKCPTWVYGEWGNCTGSCGFGHRMKPYYCHVDHQVWNNSFCAGNQLDTVREKCILPPCKASWKIGNWKNCTDLCGIQERDVFCMESGYKRVIESRCTKIKPETKRDCPKCDNFIDSFGWKTGAWTNCSEPCHPNQHRMRKVACVNDENYESESRCSVDKKPTDRESCLCYRWKVNAWSVCSKNYQRRRVNCVLNSKTVDLNLCNNRMRPKSVRPCKRRLKQNSNDEFQWRYSKWSNCSNYCGKGVRRRTVSCFNIIQNSTYVEGHCAHLRKPKKSVKECWRTNCKFIWVESEWSPCSVSCGQGKKHRKVTCHKVLEGGLFNPNVHEFQWDQYCDVYNKPAEMDSCLEMKCGAEFKWHADSWGNCSQSCGEPGGHQIRQITCMDSFNNIVSRKMCQQSSKPKRKRRCNQHPCAYESCKDARLHGRTDNADYLLRLKGQFARVYCYKMDSAEPEEFISLQPGRENFAEIYDKQLLDENSCPFNGQRDKCKCRTIHTNGKTFFWKVRLNITSLQIIVDDFTFSKEIYGTMKVPYGSAGDCYTRVPNCVQGRFSVDLTETAFKISREVQWVPSESGFIRRLDITENRQRVIGTCGGFCGKCSPDLMTGLKVEVT